MSLNSENLSKMIPSDESMDKEGSPDSAADSPQALFGLMKSNSVSARASMWQQMQVQANKGIEFEFYKCYCVNRCIF